jgi:branched-chain amino acid transport system substrate-binding protein
MSLKWTSIVAAAAMICGVAAPAVAANQIFVPLFTYRTGPFSGSGVPVANGMHDYLEMLNQKDGGIGGVKLDIEECEDGYDTKKGIECYEADKSKNPVMVNPFSTGITEALIPHAHVDHIPILSMAYGLSASALGDTFPWVFNPPDTYWDGASVIIKYIADHEGGFAKLKGETLGFIYLDVAYGKEPIPLLQTFARKYGFTLKLYPVPFTSMQNQSSLWLEVRRDRPKYMIMWGWGAMQPTAVKAAIRADYPMSHFIANWWFGDDDILGAGPKATGFRNLNFTAVGTNFPALHWIKQYVIDKGLSKTPTTEFGDELYDRAVYNSVLIAEAIQNAQKLTGKKIVDGTDVRRGLETLDLTKARMKELGLAGFAAPLKLTCADHNSHGPVFIQKWNGEHWVKASGEIMPMTDEVVPLLKAAAGEYVEHNTGWPKRTEGCDHSS